MKIPPYSTQLLEEAVPIPHGSRICMLFVKFFARICAPLTAALFVPFPSELKLQRQRLSKLDTLYCNVGNPIDNLVQTAGLKGA